MYDLLDWFLTMRLACDKFTLLADRSKQVPKLTGGRLYSSFELDEEEWTIVQLLKEVLEESARATQSFSSDSTPALYRALPSFEFVMKRWEKMLDKERFLPVHSALIAGIESLRKYYELMDVSSVYIVSLALNPAFKMEYFRTNWSDSDYKKGVYALQVIFDQYAAFYTNLLQSTGQPSALSTTSSLAAIDSAGGPGSMADNNFGISWMLSATTKRISEETQAVNPRKELTNYLDSPLEVDASGCKAIEWWGHHQLTYPILSRLARDYLAIPASSTASERAFSSAGLIGTDRRSRLGGELFEHIQILKSGMKNGDISASSETVEYLRQRSQL